MVGTAVFHHPPPAYAARKWWGHPRPPQPGQLVVLMAERVDFPVGQSYPWHTQHCWELCVQRERPTRLGDGGVIVETRPGDVWLWPPRHPHGTWNDGPGAFHQEVILFECNRVPLVERNPGLRAVAGQPLCRLRQDELPWFDQLFHQLWWEQAVRGPAFETVQESLLRILLVGLERRRRSDAGAPAPTAQVHADVLRFFSQVRASLASSDPLAAAARQLGVNYDSLRHRFKRELGIAPKRLLANLRMDQARQLLLTTRLPVSEIAARLGYAGAPQFTAFFKRHAGVAPAHWRQTPR